MTPIEVFLWGMGGSLATDVVAAARYYDADLPDFPVRYRKVGYYVVRTLLALTAGGLALAYRIDTALLAINVGVSAPLILQAMSRGLAPSVETTTSRSRAKKVTT